MKVANASVLGVDALLGARLTSGRPFPSGATEDAFVRQIFPLPPTAGWFRAMGCGDPRNGKIPLRAENPLREPGMTPESLAWTLLEPLEG
jgi:hypothetical protein